MTRFRKLEETFDLDPIVNLDETSQYDDNIEEEIDSAMSHAQQIDEHFQQLRARDAHDREMDEIAEMAIQAHKDLRDLGMSVEVRHAGEIFSSSGTMLKIGLDAKNSKIDKRLKLLKLQLDKLKMDRAAIGNKSETSIDGDAKLIDRNELLAQVREELSQIEKRDK